MNQITRIDNLRARMPVGSDRMVTFKGRKGDVTLHATIVDHARDAVILGVHPDLLHIGYADIVRVDRVKA